MSENPDTDDEVGLTEDEIKEITGENELELGSMDMGDIESSINAPFLAEKKNTPSGKKDEFEGVEEIDLSDLDDKIDAIDLGDWNKNVADTDKQEDVQDLGLVHDVPEKTQVSNATPHLPLSNKKPSPSKKLVRLPSNKGKKVKKNPNSVKIKSTNKLTNKMISSRKKPSSPKKPNRISKTPIPANDLQMKTLFLRLDELLSHLPPEKIKEFALSKEYEIYFNLLKKFGI